MYQTPDSPNSSGKSGVSLLPVVFRRQVDVGSLIGGVGMWGELAGGAEVKQLDLEGVGVEEYVLVFDVSVVDSTGDEVVDNLMKRCVKNKTQSK